MCRLCVVYVSVWCRFAVPRKFATLARNKTCEIPTPRNPFPPTFGLRNRLFTNSATRKTVASSRDWPQNYRGREIQRSAWRVGSSYRVENLHMRRRSHRADHTRPARPVVRLDALEPRTLFAAPTLAALPNVTLL